MDTSHNNIVKMSQPQQPQNGFMLTNRAVVERDYSEGITCRFEKSFPVALRGKIDETTFLETINHINAIFAKAEALNFRAYLLGCLSCLTAYSSLLCFRTHYEKCLQDVANYIDEQNSSIYEARGLKIINPMEKGLRVIEIEFIPQV
ncbi:Golgin subfamily A member 7 [Trichoplax sp. H2]|nr:Golgin subfamily A member 7 [Trichoplax sp. H2]|eukprot:RDD45549.1 Golgin subfamily A member 7 [Trichoplax sp. H2]